MSMLDTDQLNIRMSKGLLFDLEFIARATGISKNEWVRYNVAKQIQKEKEELLRKLELEYVNERKNADEFKSITGYAPSAILQAERQAHHQKIMELVNGKEHRKFARQALLSNVKKAKGSRGFKS